MWKLSLPDDNGRLDELSTALTYKNGSPKYTLLQGEQDELEQIYDFYHENRGLPHIFLEGERISAGTKDALKACYAEVQEKGRLSDLRARLFLNAKKCPLCGIEATTDLDHYLPESKYHCLSIYARNLIPTCHKCNNKKRTAVARDGVGFLHLYYFEEPTVVFFIANTVMNNSALSISFSIEQVPEFSQDVYDSLCFQIERINLNDRLVAEANDFLGSMFVSFEMTFDASGKEGLRALLKRTRDNYTQRFGLNHWKRALIDSLSMNEEFLNGGFKTALGTPVED
ncbi:MULTISPECIES: HNH endonuclease [Enterobacteriaceae]|uniref:HNH endonuclease n=1 Tax=Tenebrionibacter intestinalis TaxID=2799638 RepID=A0A8K0XXC4_9ENTR|nr:MULTISPECIES: HNH endonuclease signature motif containing protein [Enterobacteriaceae]HAV1886469.1 HNH endonuclease [Enterobacter hormaechei subsp. xiangfangensis]EHN8814398.1 HNH endonuclease [Enterobacter hormaechei]EHN8822654.1 HNH endonuclease [Enterobacter hormaechei]ELC7445977.1 HNH endonuclease [Enterobacter hormaechei]MBJ6538853.1 HNH endonuclease [Enterobacter hormaechei]